jgi:hypothetical protein
MPDLRQSLLNTSLVRLRAISRFWEIPLTESRQREVALALTDAMADPAAAATAEAKLDDEERQALQALLASDGHMPRKVFVREWGEIRSMGPGRMEREKPWEKPVSPADGLWYHGFIFERFKQGPDGAYDAVFVPPELARHLSAPDAAGPQITLEPADPPAEVVAMEDQLLDDACTMLAYVQNERPRLRPDAPWTGRHKQRVLNRLRAQDQARLAFLSHLLSCMGWVTAGEKNHLRLVPETVTAWLQDDTFQQRRAVAETWRDDSTWNDLFHVPGLQPEETGAWRNEPVLARKAVLRHLRACAPDTWYAFDIFVAGIKQVDPDFQRPAGDYESWYIRDRETGLYVSGFESWDAVEGRLIRYLLTRPLAWLGLVELGKAGSEEPPHAFRLSPEGAAFLELADPPAPSPPPRARLGPGFEISMPAPRRYERFQLARVARWVETGDRFIYRLTPTSLERAQQQGIAIPRVLEFLQEITEAPLPRPVEEALSRWNVRGAEVHLKREVLLRVSEEELMDRIVASPRLIRLIEERVGPTAAIVRRQDWLQLVARLGEMGLLPEVMELSQ